MLSKAPSFLESVGGDTRPSIPGGVCPQSTQPCLKLLVGGFMMGVVASLQKDPPSERRWLLS